MGKKNKENLKKGAGLFGSVKTSKWRQEATYRRDNKHWLKKSQYIAIVVLKTLREKKMTQVELSTILRVTPQQVSKIVKGRENLQLETISNLEKALGIVLIDTKNFNKVNEKRTAETVLEPQKISIDLNEFRDNLLNVYTELLKKILKSRELQQKNSLDAQEVYSNDENESYLYLAA